GHPTGSCDVDELSVGAQGDRSRNGKPRYGGSYRVGGRIDHREGADPLVDHIGADLCECGAGCEHHGQQGERYEADCSTESGPRNVLDWIFHVRISIHAVFRCFRGSAPRKCGPPKLESLEPALL